MQSPRRKVSRGHSETDLISESSGIVTPYQLYNSAIIKVAQGRIKR